MKSLKMKKKKRILRSYRLSCNDFPNDFAVSIPILSIMKISRFSTLRWIDDQRAVIYRALIRALAEIGCARIVGEQRRLSKRYRRLSNYLRSYETKKKELRST